MPDLAALAQIAPQYAAILAGREGANQDLTSQIAQQKALDDIVQQQTTRAQQAQKFPLELDELTAGNNLKNAQAGNFNASASHQGIVNRGLEATQPGEIAATNVGNAVKSYQQIAQHFGSLADAVDQNPN